MSLLTISLVPVIAVVIFWLANSFIPKDHKITNIINRVICSCCYHLAAASDRTFEFFEKHPFRKIK